MESVTAAASPTSTNRTFAIISHVAGLLTSWLGPLVIYLIKKSEPGEAFATQNAKEALNFQITLFIVMVVLMATVVGIFLIFVPLLFNLVCCIIAAIKASNGEDWRYPLTLRLIK